MKSFTSKHTTKAQSNSASNDTDNSLPHGKLKIKTVQGKPVIMRPNARTVLNLKSRKFAERLLCDGITLHPERACVFDSASSYVGPQMSKVNNPYLEACNDERRFRGEAELDFENVVIPLPDPVGLLRKQLLHKSRKPKFTDPDDNRVVYGGSTRVDVAATMELLRETAALCNMILDSTSWQIRLLSESYLLARLFKDKLIPNRHRHRMILGFSTGSLYNTLATMLKRRSCFLDLERIEALRWLQDEGYRTFGMISPSLPQADGDYVRFSREICEAIRVDRCEHVWAEVINLRGKSLAGTLAGLHGAGYKAQAEALSAVMGQGNKDAREQVARATFLAHTMHVPAEKLRYLQYVDDNTVEWWAGQRVHGAVLLGKVAERKNLTHVIG